MSIRSLARKSVIEILSPLATPKNGVYLLNGHYLCSDDSLDPGLFQRQLKKLRNHYGFINFEDALNLIDEGQDVVSRERLIAFTFDDGFFECVSSIAPTLIDFGVNACFFINSNFIESSDQYQVDFTVNRVHTPGKKPMTWDNVRSLDDNGFVIGNHTKDHLRLSDISEPEFLEQVKDSNDEIECQIGKKCEFFAWPYGGRGDITNSQLQILSSMYKYIFSSADYKKYFSFGGKVYNRRHFEPFWPASHVRYFLSKGKTY